MYEFIMVQRSSIRVEGAKFITSIISILHSFVYRKSLETSCPSHLPLPAMSGRVWLPVRPPSSVRSQSSTSCNTYRQRGKGQTGTTEVHLINDVSHQWEEVALSLHFKDAAIRNISKDNPRDCKAACREMFAQWLRGKPGTRQPTTWRH